MQSNLFQLRDILEDQNQALERERDENLTSNVRSAVYKANDIRNLAWRCWYMGDALRKAESKLKQRPQEYKKYRERIENFYHLLETSTDHYRSSVESLSRVPEDRIRNKIQQMKKEYSGEDLVNKAMFKNTEVLERHADFARRQGIDELTIKQVWRDLIMPQMLEEIESIYNHGTPPAKESKKKSEKK
jgi:hypothetical protein